MQVTLRILPNLLTLLLLIQSMGKVKAQQLVEGISSKQLSAYIQTVQQKANKLSQKISQTQNKALQSFTKQEEKLLKKLLKKDSNAVKQYLQQKQNSLQTASNAPEELLQKINSNKAIQTTKEYIPNIDSLQTSLQFISSKAKQHQHLSVINKTGDALKKVKDLQQELANAANVKKYVQQQKEQLKQLAQNHPLTKQLKTINKQVYYYQQQIQEYKNLLKDKKKIEQKLLATLTETAVFQNFMKQNSQLASLFGIPNNNAGLGALNGNATPIAGLQTRAQVQQMIQAQLGMAANVPNTGNNSGPNPQQYVQQQMQAAQDQLNNLKNKANQYIGGNNNDAVEMPNFKPNNQKTKSFLQRLEYGLNVQSTRGNNLLPSITDIAATIGYKLNDKSVIGVGVAYKMGWGKPINDIKISHEGIGLRSFVDIKFPSFGGGRGGNGIWLTGGYEQNYMQSFEKIPLLNDYSKWQRSGLLGLTKKYKVGKKQGNLQLLWNFLSYQNIPQTQPIIFRTGLNF